MKFRPASRPRRDYAHRSRGQVRRQDHHSGYRQGEAFRGRGDRRRSRWPRREPASSIPIDLKTGDRVLFGKWSGTEVKIDGVEYLIMKESDIMGVIEQTNRPQEGCLRTMSPYQKHNGEQKWLRKT